MLGRFVRTVIGSWRVGSIAIASAIIFSIFYMVWTGILTFYISEGYIGFSVYEAYRDPLIINSRYLIVVEIAGGGFIISVSPLAVILMAINSTLIGLNVGAIIRVATSPRCCNVSVKRQSGVLAGSAILASLGLFSCCAGGLITALLGSLGLLWGVAFLWTYGPLLQVIASIVLGANLVYLYRRLSRTGISASMDMRLRLSGGS
jgi:hypothetical protein